jgi:UPF0716 family protein affecting phage T7 exclusion
MDDRNWRFPNIGRELAIVGAVFLIVAGFVGALVGLAVDVLIHRHRAHRPT